MLEEQGHRVGRLTAGPEALQHPGDHQQHGREDAHAVVGGQRAHREGGARREQDDDDQSALPPDAVSERPEEEAAERSENEPDGGDGESG
ncbi:hypothetical protein J2S52_005387 [Streptomyces sp. DSM 41037]|nr:MULTISPECIES: hypothetical protein [unclassified Streptomyces]MDQ0297348.1 hypothetical protein [Streptomyces sp. DSM 41037]